MAIAFIALCIGIIIGFMFGRATQTQTIIYKESKDSEKKQRNV